MILGNPGIVFATTNNIYPACTRSEGLEEFHALFADRVEGRYGKLYGQQGKPSRWPTDWQAEVLYPHELRYEHLRQIYTQLGETEDSVRGVLGGLDLSVIVSHEPEVFA